MKKFRQFKQHAQKEEKKSNLGVYWSIFIAVIMIGAVGGIFFSNPNTSSEYVYGKYSFFPKDGLWTSKIDKKIYSFYFLPDQVSQINLSEQTKNALTDRSGIIILFDPEQNESLKLQALDLFRFEFADTYSKTHSQNQLGFAVTANTSLYNLPVASCANATFPYPVLSLEYASETKITYNADCIHAQALDERSVLMLLDLVRYELLGVFDETK